MKGCGPQACAARVRADQHTYGLLNLPLKGELPEKVDALLYSVKSWLFTSLTALNLLGLSFVWHQSRARMLSGLKLLLTMLGTVSLQVYLIHPAIQQWLERSYPPGSVQPLTQVTLYGYLSLIIPAILASLIRNTRLSTLLFGR